MLAQIPFPVGAKNIKVNGIEWPTIVYRQTSQSKMQGAPVALMLLGSEFDGHAPEGEYQVTAGPYYEDYGWEMNYSEYDPFVIYDDDETFWTAGGGGGAGTYRFLPTEETTIVARGSSSLKLTTLSDGTYADPGVYHTYSPKQDWSDKRYIILWFYGQNNGKNYRFFVMAPDASNYKAWDFPDDHAGWKLVVIDMIGDTPDEQLGTLDLSQTWQLILRLRTATGGEVAYLDRTVVDTDDKRFLKLFYPANVGDEFVTLNFNSLAPVLLCDKREITFDLMVPVSDSPDYVVQNQFLLHGNPYFDKIDSAAYWPFLRLYASVNTNGLLWRLDSKDDAGNIVTFWDGTTHEQASPRSETADRFARWRFIFHDEPQRHFHVYMKHGATRSAMENAVENELDNGPYSLEDPKITMNFGFPIYRLRSSSTSLWVPTDPVEFDYFRINDLPLKWTFDLPEEYRNQDQCRLRLQNQNYLRILDHDIELDENFYMENGLICVYVNYGQQFGVQLGFYDQISESWKLPPIKFTSYNADLTAHACYPYLKKIKTINPDQITIELRLHDSASEDDDLFADVEITIRRGIPIVWFKITYIHPAGSSYNIQFTHTGTRIGYLMDGEVSDTDFAPVATNNTDPTDCYIVLFDEDGDPYVSVVGATKLPAQFTVFDGYDAKLTGLTHGDLPAYGFWGACRFPDVNFLVKECESDYSLIGGASAESDANASGGQAAKLDNQYEAVYLDWDAGFELKPGRYLVLFRIRDTAQVVNDVGISIKNITDNVWRHHLGYTQAFKATSSYKYYEHFFYVTEEDAKDRDSIRFNVYKAQTTSNEIYVDYSIVIPIGCGDDYAIDLAHNAFYFHEQEYEVEEA